MRRFFLSAPYRRRLEMVRCAEDLKALGQEVCSRWIYGNREAIQPRLVHDPELVAIRNVIIGENLGDLGEAHALIHFSDAEPASTTIPALVRRFGLRMINHKWDEEAWRTFREIELREDRTDRRGTRHVEMGIAIGMELDIILIGPPENVFHQAPFVSQFADWHEFIENVRAVSLRGKEDRRG